MSTVPGRQSWWPPRIEHLCLLAVCWLPFNCIFTPTLCRNCSPLRFRIKETKAQRAKVIGPRSHRAVKLQFHTHPSTAWYGGRGRAMKSHPQANAYQPSLIPGLQQEDMTITCISYRLDGRKLAHDVTHEKHPGNISFYYYSCITSITPS